MSDGFRYIGQGWWGVSRLSSAEARLRGCAGTHGELDVGASAVAVPIRGSGRPGPEIRAPEEPP